VEFIARMNRDLIGSMMASSHTVNQREGGKR
jgi:hypothetical protein